MLRTNIILCLLASLVPVGSYGAVLSICVLCITPSLVDRPVRQELLRMLETLYERQAQ